MNDIQQWLDNPGHDYSAGVTLFARYSKNRALVRYFQSGTARFRMGKLVYEMGKLAKAASSAGSHTATKAVVVIDSDQHPRLASDVTAKTSDVCRRASDVSIPDFILAAKKEISSLYALIDKQHRELYDLGTSNADDVVRKRKKILDSRKPAIDRADRLYRLKEAWIKLEDGPARDRVASDIREMLAAPWKEQPTMVAPVVANNDSPLHSNVSGLSDLNLTNRRSALRSSITKAQNMLQYQTIRKGDFPTPMPPGPKRDEYERKLAVLKAELTAVCDELERRKPA